MFTTLSVTVKISFNTIVLLCIAIEFCDNCESIVLRSLLASIEKLLVVREGTTFELYAKDVYSV